MLFRRRVKDGEDARQGDGREVNLRVLITSMVIVVALLIALYFAFGFGTNPSPTTAP